MDLSQAIIQISSSIIQICFSATELSMDLQRRVGTPFITEILGTGFYVNSDAYIITARHVIQKGRRLIDQIDARRKKLFIEIGLPNSENFVGNTVLVDFEFIDEDEIHDLALLRLRRNPF